MKEVVSIKDLRSEPMITMTNYRKALKISEKGKNDITKIIMRINSILSLAVVSIFHRE